MNFYRGVVEDNLDPEKLGRVKVRIWGLHTENNENSGESFEFIQTDDLPWAEVMGGVEFGLIGGVGLSTVLRQGTWVWIILDHDNPNKPIIVGTIIGNVVPRDFYSAGQGFNDKDEEYPFLCRNDEPDFNRLARNEQLSSKYYESKPPSKNTTIHNEINKSIDDVEGTDSVSGADISQIEPESLNSSSEYPNVSILETHSGHVIELDDTTDNERIRIYHRTGSYMEIRPDGTFVQKCVNEDAESHYIHMSDVENHIAKGVKTYIEKNIDEIIDGGIRRNVKLDNFQHIGGYFKIQADGNLEIINDVKITGMLHVTKGILSDDDIHGKKDVRDLEGNLSSLRNQYDAHEHSNPGTSDGASQGPTTGHPADPRAKIIVQAWSNSPLGFK